jgi:hypothetical protein
MYWNSFSIYRIITAVNNLPCTLGIILNDFFVYYCSFSYNLHEMGTLTIAISRMRKLKDQVTLSKIKKLLSGGTSIWIQVVCWWSPHCRFTYRTVMWLSFQASRPDHWKKHGTLGVPFISSSLLVSWFCSSEYVCCHLGQPIHMGHYLGSSVLQEVSIWGLSEKPHINSVLRNVQLVPIMHLIL